MDFQCDRCGQKYHVADEKLSGRAASRFKCKKCENMILLAVPAAPAAPHADLGAVSVPTPSAFRAPTATGPLRSGAAAPRSPTAAAPRQRLATTTGPAYSGGAARPAATAAVRAEPAAPVAPDADEHGWFAGIRDVPVGPVSRAELQGHVLAGDVTGDTLVWRDGFADWRPLRAVPALKDLLPPLRVVSQRPSHPPISFAEPDGDATVISDQGPAMVAAAMKAASADRHEQSLQEAPTRKLSALTGEQLRGIHLPPVTAERPAAEKPAAPAVAKAPVAKPAAPKAPIAPARPSTGVAARSPTLAPTVPRKSETLTRKPAAAPEPAARPATPSAPPPAPAVAEAPARPVSSPPPAPAAARSVSSAPPPPAATSSPSVAAEPAAPKHSDASFDALAMPTMQEAATARASMPPAAPALSSPALSSPTPGWDDPLFRPSTPGPTPSSPEPVQKSAAWSDPVFDSHVPPAPSAVGAVAPASLTSPSVPTSLTNTGPLGVAVDVARPKPRSMPRGAWVLAAGLAMVGIAGGIALSRRGPQRSEIVAASVSGPGTASPVEPPAARPESAAAPVSVVPEDPASPDMTFTVGDDSPAAREHRRRAAAAGNRAPAAAAVTTQQRQAQLERALGLSPGAAPSAPAPTLPQNLRNQPAAPSPGASAPPAAQQSGTVSALGSTHTRDVVRERTAVDLVDRSGVVRRCWDQFKLRNPAAPARRLSINVSVNESGQVSLQVSDRSDPMLTTCIENRSSTQIRSLGEGSAVRTSLAVTLN